MKALKISVTLSLLIFTGIGRADPLDSWTWRNPLLTGKALHSIAFGSGQFVAVGSAGTIVTSADGRSWAVRQSGTGSNLSGVAYGNGQFVAMGYDDILTSTDGVNWVQSQSGTGWTISGVTYGNGQFVAVGYQGTIVTSADGANWIQHQAGTQDDLQGIAYGNGQFVAVGNKDGIIITSSDAVNWVPRAEECLGAVAYGNGQFVAVGGYDFGTILTSADGVNWVWRAAGTPTYLHGITYGNGHFVAVGGYGTILQSGSIITLAITPNVGTGLLKLSLEGPTGLDYTIQTSTDLMSWQSVTNITTTQPISFILDALPADSSHVFYRAYSQ